MINQISDVKSEIWDKSNEDRVFSDRKIDYRARNRVGNFLKVFAKSLATQNFILEVVNSAPRISRFFDNVENSSFKAFLSFTFDIWGPTSERKKLE